MKEELTASDRDFLGEQVRKVWIEWALKQPVCKPSWIVPYEQLSEPDKEVDRLIGEALYQIGYKNGYDHGYDRGYNSAMWDAES